MSIEKEVKIRCYVKKWKLLKNGEAPVLMPIRFNNERTEFGLKENVKPKLWDDKLERITGITAKADKINALIALHKQRIFTIKFIFEGEGVKASVLNIKEKLLGKKENRKTVVRIFEECNNDARKLIGKDFAYDTVQRYDTTLIKKRYNREDMAFNELTPQMMRQFEIYFKTERNCSHKTTIKYLKNFKKRLYFLLYPMDG